MGEIKTSKPRTTGAGSDKRTFHQDSICTPSSVGFFPTRLHDLLDYAEQHRLGSIISWTMKGRAFEVRDPDKLSRLLLLFFSQTRFRSFQRQLLLWSFEKIADGPYKGCMIHPYFARGQRAIVSNMSRNCFKRPASKRSSQENKKLKTPRGKYTPSLPVENPSTTKVSIPRNGVSSGRNKIKWNDSFDTDLTSSPQKKLKIDEDPEKHELHKDRADEFEGRRFFLVDIPFTL